LKILDIYTPEKEPEILEALKDYFVVTSPRFNYPIPKIDELVKSRSLIIY
jgi:hypothetical protein